MTATDIPSEIVDKNSNKVQMTDKVFLSFPVTECLELQHQSSLKGKEMYHSKFLPFSKEKKVAL